MNPKRYHLILDLKGAKSLSDKQKIEEVLTKLPSLIGMKILDGPHVVEGVPENPGITGFVIIDFSHISVHTFTNSGEALIDIFSCKPYSQQVAKTFVVCAFRPTELSEDVVSWGGEDE